MIMSEQERRLVLNPIRRPPVRKAKGIETIPPPTTVLTIARAVPAILNFPSPP